MSGYAELHALSNFSFLRGASHPAELIDRAHALGYRALALTDECSLAGVVRAHEALQALTGARADFKLIIGAEFSTVCGLKLVLLAPQQRGLRADLPAHHARPPPLEERRVSIDAGGFRDRPRTTAWRCGCRRAGGRSAGE